MISNKCLEDFDRDAAIFKAELMKSIDERIRRNRIFDIYKETGLLIYESIK